MEQYLSIGKNEKAKALAEQFVEETIRMVRFFATPYGNASLSNRELDTNVTLLYYVVNIFDRYGEKEYANSIKRRMTEM
jgi:hypothetical protein